ncbi:MAG: DUF6628 family protein [Sphingorhabdus sp.]
MHPDLPETVHPLPFAAPIGGANRLVLYAIRRMGAHGLHDAHAANALLGQFGMAYRRPLIMLRAFVAESARGAEKRIMISACCCVRMTLDEARLLEAICASLNDPQGADLLLRQTMGSNSSLGALSSAQAVAAAFSDLGWPLD